MSKLKLVVGKTALVFGFFVALMHAVWMLLIFLGVAQFYLNWIFGLHLLSNPYLVLPFNFGTALMLVVFTFVVGYIMGWVFAFIWNRLHKGR